MWIYTHTYIYIYDSGSPTCAWYLHCSLASSRCSVVARCCKQLENKSFTSIQITSWCSTHRERDKPKEHTTSTGGRRDDDRPRHWYLPPVLRMLWTCAWYLHGSLASSCCKASHLFKSSQMFHTQGESWPRHHPHPQEGGPWKFLET